jgi:hypothetical protein
VTAAPPGHVSGSYRELAWLFASGAWRDEEAQRLRTEFRSRYCEFDDGRAAERVVRTLLLGKEDWMPEQASAARVPSPAAGHDQLASS